VGRHKKLYRDKKYLDMVALYQSGEPISGICAKFDMSSSVLYKVLRARNVPLRGGATERRLVEHIPDIIRLYTEECFTIRELSAQFEANTDAIYRILKKNGVVRRSPSARFLSSRELELDICRDYLDLRSAPEVGEKYQLSHVIVLQIARAYGIITSDKFRQTCRRHR